jgi:uncharacterized metal-binding protein
MPSGKTHALITTAASAGIIAYGLSSGYPNAEIAAIAGGCLIGIIVTPDLDVRGEIRANRIVDRQFGWMIGYSWRLAWLPYSRLIPRHRHFLSHAPIVSTLFRVAYIFIWALAIAGLLGFSLAAWPAWLGSLPDNPGWLGLMIGGLMVSDVLHWLADSVL